MLLFLNAIFTFILSKAFVAITETQADIANITNIKQFTERFAVLLWFEKSKVNMIASVLYASEKVHSKDIN